MAVNSERLVVCIYSNSGIKIDVLIIFLGYALKDVAVYYIMKTNPSVFLRLGRGWDGDENSYCHVIIKQCILKNIKYSFLVHKDQTKGSNSDIPDGAYPGGTYLYPVSGECIPVMGHEPETALFCCCGL